jgi:hypothetical protein
VLPSAIVRSISTRCLVLFITLVLFLFSACVEKPSKEKTEDSKEMTSHFPSQFLDIETKKTEEGLLSNEQKGGITCVVTLIDNTIESWPFKIVKGDSTISGYSEETRINEFLEIDPGIYDIVFPFTEIDFPPIREVKIKSGYTTRVVMNLPSRFTITAMKKERSIRIFSAQSGKDIGKKSHSFGKYETGVYDCLPGTYKLVYVYTEEKREDIILEVNEGETVDIKLE